MPNYVVNNIKLLGSDKDVQDIFELLKNKNPNDKEIDFNNVVPMPKSLDLVSGGNDRWYVAAYVKTLSDVEKAGLMKALAAVSTSFYVNYFRKYIDSFTKEIPEISLKTMTENFKKDYASINPSSIEEVGKTYVNNILSYGADTWYDWCCDNWGTKWGAMNSIIGEEYNLIYFQTAWSASLPVTTRLSQMFPDVVFVHDWADEDLFGTNCGRYVFKNGEIVEEYLPEGKEAIAFACDMWDCDPDEYDVSGQSFVSLEDVVATIENESATNKQIVENAQKLEAKSKPTLDNVVSSCEEVSKNTNNRSDKGNVEVER